MRKELEMPEGLCAKGVAAYNAIVALLEKRNALDTGGCKAFYSPAEWRERGEDYAQNAVLIVVHDGGDHAPYFNWDYGYARGIEAVMAALLPHGVFAEQATSWYSGIYPT
jgi:hypothetical protein